VALIAQLSIGVLLVSWQVPAVAQALHVAGAAAVWAATVALAAFAARSPLAPLSPTRLSPTTESGAENAPTLSDRVNAYISLTKPRIISLLLLTTFAGMVLAANGMPPLGLVLATMIGGALGAGGANAINCWIDRDIDSLMRRTVLRAIPSGIVTPGNALAFGIALGVGAFVVMAVFVNLLAALLTTGALVYYVGVYTQWLKRSSVQNIVIGGAAGAVPPLVGWVAVTGEISLLAIYLFAIVFYWTPPHFWALSLLIKGDYARAKVPMLPVVRGDDETRRQILLYSVLLAALTAVMFAVGLLGPIYLVGALIFGGLFVLFSAQLCREATQASARRLYKYSLLYLPLLFGAMIVDRLRV
jgi:protoheme IX farnesyltransferase